MLTTRDVKAARPRAASYKLSDAGGLHLYIAPTGLRSWRWRFRLGGKEQLLTIGGWPEISLDQARAARDVARAQLARGEDPRDRGGTADEAKADTFEQVSRRWHEESREGWTDVHAADVLASLERDIFPAIGAMPIGAITSPVILNALRVIEERGTRETARRIRQRISAVFAFAITEQMVDADPSAFLARRLKAPAQVRHHPALLDIADARALLAAAELVDAAPAIKLASRFLALTAVRLAAVRGARWSEIEDLDGDAPLWRIPAARMKLAAAKKRDPRHDHLVPLSRQAVELLRTIRTSSDACATPTSDNACYVTPNVIHDAQLIFVGRGADRAIGEAAIGALYDRAGFAGRHVPHGWRATFSTILNERSPGDRAEIDRALGHAGGKRDKEEEGINRKVEGAYNRSVHLAPRRRLFQAWADELDEPGSTPG